MASSSVLSSSAALRRAHAVASPQRTSSLSSLIWSLSATAPCLPSLPHSPPRTNAHRPPSLVHAPSPAHARAFSSTPARPRWTSRSKTESPQPAAGELAQEDVDVSGMTLEQQVEFIESLRRRAKVMNAYGLDIWDGPTETLDVMIPPPPWRLSGLRARLQNFAKNAAAMYQLMSDGFFRRRLSWLPIPFSPQIFLTSSTSRRAWLAPHRAQFVDLYKRMNSAVAAGDIPALRGLARDAFLKDLRARCETSRRAPHLQNWSLHTLHEARVLSVRAAPVYLAASAPRTGSRLAVQALVRFRSTQTLRVLDRTTGARVQGRGQWEPREVLEYFVFERRLWKEESAWLLRDRLFEDA
ncbi:hypothetical protein K488DRAFT_82693 [Vararia minispora EC-137]|uniref:Uncharacterized protein n=1 Tax=Vararia minispora EC-137 TaxID=1314806 RepID=A0ACB8QVI6_9AGAM|nr:hypothetical protein K488DRAFT_82693 [Vararia minispora EC-137]